MTFAHHSNAHFLIPYSFDPLIHLIVFLHQKDISKFKSLMNEWTNESLFHFSPFNSFSFNWVSPFWFLRFYQLLSWFSPFFHPFFFEFEFNPSIEFLVGKQNLCTIKWISTLFFVVTFIWRINIFLYHVFFSLFII